MAEARGPAPLSEEQLRTAGNRLRRERERTADRLHLLRHDHDEQLAVAHANTADDEHDPEGATLVHDRAETQWLVRHAEQELAEVADAERRLRDGSYGTCTGCGRAIAQERLVALPATELCIRCAQKHR